MCFHSSMLRIRYSWDNKFETDESWMVTKYDWDTVKVNAVKESDHYLLQTAQAIIKIYLPSLKIDVINKGGELLSSE